MQNSRNPGAVVKKVSPKKVCELDRSITRITRGLMKKGHWETLMATKTVAHSSQRFLAKSYIKAKAAAVRMQLEDQSRQCYSVRLFATILEHQSYRRTSWKCMEIWLDLVRYTKSDSLGPVLQPSGRYEVTIRIHPHPSVARRLEAQLASANQWPPAWFLPAHGDGSWRRLETFG